MSNPSLALYRSRWLALRARIQQTWSDLSLREQRTVAGGALLLLGLLLWGVLVQPALKKIDYWQIETPKLQAQSEALDVLLRDVSVAPAGPDLEPALRQTLDANGLAGHYQLSALQDGTWQLTFKAAPADDALDWLLRGQPQFSLQVIEARLQRGNHDMTDNTTDNTVDTLSGSVRMDQAQVAKEA
ncbi:hypothetical protein PS3A_11180 [Pseudomonas sp. 3A(2025)]